MHLGFCSSTPSSSPWNLYYVRVPSHIVFTLWMSGLSVNSIPQPLETKLIACPQVLVMLCLLEGQRSVHYAVHWELTSIWAWINVHVFVINGVDCFIIFVQMRSWKNASNPEHTEELHPLLSTHMLAHQVYHDVFYIDASGVLRLNAQFFALEPVSCLSS